MIADRFVHTETVEKLVARHTLPAVCRTLERTSSRHQAVATTELRAGDPLTATTVAFKRLRMSYRDHDPKLLPMLAKTFIAAGAGDHGVQTLSFGPQGHRATAGAGEIEYR